MPANHQVSISTRRLILTLAAAAFVLVVCHVVLWTLNYRTTILERGPHIHFALLFDLDREASFGTWLTSAMFLLAGVLTLVQANSRRAQRDPWDRWWWVLGVGLAFLSLEEVVGLHENLNSDIVFVAAMGHWTVLGAAIVAVLGVAILPFLWRLPVRTLVLFLAAGALYVAGVIGVEFATIGYEDAGRLNTLAYTLWNGLEEGLEMAGVILYLYALLEYMARMSEGPVRAQVKVRR